MDEALGQVWRDLIANNQVAESLQPSIEPFGLPMAFLAARLAAALCSRFLSILGMLTDQFGVLAHSEWIAVHRSDIDQS